MIENPSEGWIDPGKQAIIINMGHPAWKVADGLTLQARDERVRVYHVLRTAFVTLVEEGVESPKDTLQKLFSYWVLLHIRDFENLIDLSR